MINILKQKKIALLLLLPFLLFPEIADAWAFDKAQTALQGLSEATGGIAAFVIIAFAVFWIGQVLLYFSSGLVQGVIDATPELLTLSGEGMGNIVEAGWGFSVGIVNMLLILAFVFIALSILLGFDTYGLKKLLPRFVIVALLVNFTLMFVGMGIDISNFLWHSLSGFFEADGEFMFWEAMKPLMDHMGALEGTIYTILGGWASSLAVPYLNVAVQIGWLVMTTVFLSTIFEFLTFGIIAILMSFVLFIFFFVLFARIFIVQLLAIIAPFAFFCLIFDKTNSYFHKWVEHLVQWLLVGVVFLFFMYLGVTMAPYVEIMGLYVGEALDDVLPGWLSFLINNIEEIVSYIALLLYFVIIMGVCYKFIPAAAQAAISQVSGAAKAASPYIAAAGKGQIKKTGKALRETKDFTQQWRREGFSAASQSARQRMSQESGLGKFRRRAGYEWDKFRRTSQEDVEKREMGEKVKNAKSPEEVKKMAATETSPHKLRAILDKANEDTIKEIKNDVPNFVNNITSQESFSNASDGEKRKIIKNFTDEAISNIGAQDIASSLKPSDLADEDLAQKIGGNNNIMRELINEGDMRKIEKTLQNAGRNGIEAFNQEIRNAQPPEDIVSKLSPKVQRLTGAKRSSGGVSSGGTSGGGSESSTPPEWEERPSGIVTPREDSPGSQGRSEETQAQRREELRRQGRDFPSRNENNEDESQ